MPDRCPYCGDVLLTDFMGRNDVYTIKTCGKRVSHWIKFVGLTSANDVESLMVRLDNKRYAEWNLLYKLFGISGSGTAIQLPFFYPNLSHIPSLLEKISTYVVFS